MYYLVSENLHITSCHLKAMFLTFFRHIKTNKGLN